MAGKSEMPLRYLKGVGERRAEQFARLEIATLGDLIEFYPRGYEDWTSIVSIQEAPFDRPCCIKAVALGEPVAHHVRKGLTLYKFSVSDGSSIMRVTIFNNKYAAAKITAGKEYLFFGQVGGNFTSREMASPLIEQPESGQRIRPIYRQTEGLNTRYIEICVSRALEAIDKELDYDPLPAEMRQKYGLCTRRFAIENIHFPQNSNAISIARKRLVFEELLILQLGLLKIKSRSRSANTVLIAEDYTEDFICLLPFRLTEAQSRALSECIGDIRGKHPMNRLVQGDVGSGKTAVAAGAAYTVIKNGYQAALMAPTEILAEQHAASLSALLDKGGVRIGLLTASLTAAQRREILAALSSGEIDLAVGTHALLSEGVEFHRLGLVITDEQHRFGVAQRAKLAAKGANPHILVMSATPIPRSLALIIYGDLDISILDQLPGRTPVATYAIGSDKRERAFNYIKKHIAEGRQAYIVCPLVENGEESDLASATEYMKKLSEGPFSGYKLGLLHGRMKSSEKEKVMSMFVKNEISVLVSTTVIEVEDVPNAAIMVIENAERFGLPSPAARRAGRGGTTCILISTRRTRKYNRLKVLCSTNDGFKIADEDLKLRGPGDFFGNRQHGLPDLKIADLKTDMSILRTAQAAARKVLASDPDLKLPQHSGLSKKVADLFEKVGEQAD